MTGTAIIKATITARIRRIGALFLKYLRTVVGVNLSQILAPDVSEFRYNHCSSFFNEPLDFFFKRIGFLFSIFCQNLYGVDIHIEYLPLDDLPII